MKQKRDIKALFLQEFVKELIKNAKPAELPEKVTEEPAEERFKPRPLPKGMMQSKFEIEKSTAERHLPIIPLTQPTIPGKMQRAITQELQEMKKSLRPTKKLESFPRPSGGIPIARPIPGNPNIGKLNALVTDPRVEGLECTGPNKNILVKKNGMVQKTKISLTKEEIKKIIDDFSAKTRIPLIGGTFKAASGNLIMTAVISEFVGSRFIIQKRNPFQPLV